MRLLIILTLFSAKSFGVEIHENGFSNIPAGSGAHYSGRIMQWSVWEKKAEYKEFGLPHSYIAAATKELEAPSLKDSDFTNLKGQDGTAIELLMDYYYGREKVYPEEQIQAEAVFSSKIQMDVSSSTDLNSISVDKFIKTFINSDQPHIYTPVSKDWVSGFLPSFHLAKEQLKDSSKYFLVTINSSPEIYNCPMLNFGLSRNDDALVDFSGAAYIFMVIKIDEIQNIKSLSAIESGASRAFVQEIIYSTSFIRSGKNIISIYSEEGKSKLISQSAIVITDRVMSVPEILVNPLDLTLGERVTAAASALGGSEKEFILSSKNVSIIDSNSKKCGMGLGLGVASYTYNIARMMVEGLSQ